MTLRTTSRSALLAGSLTFGLMFGGVALASEFYANGTGPEAPAAAAQSQSGQGSSADAAATTGTSSAVDASNGTVSFQVPADWKHATYRDDGVTYNIYTGPQVVFQVTTVTGDRIPGPDDDMRRTAELVEELAGDVDVDEDALRNGEVQDRTVDGATVRDISYAQRDDGRETQGYVTLVYGANSVTVAVSSYAAADASAMADVCAAVHLSLAPDAATAEDGGFLADGSGSAAKGDVAAGDTLRYEDFEYTLSDDPSTYTTVEVNGTTLVGVPVTVKNIENEPERVDVREIVLSGPSGAAQVTDASVYPEDSVYGLGRLGAGEEVTAMLYFVDEGPGDYTVTFADNDDGHVDKDAMTVVIER